ncbi:V-type ATPase subunit [Candidatus Pyrohabitans sp.]
MGVFQALVDAFGFSGAVALLSFVALLIAILVAVQPASWLLSRAPYIFPASFIRGEEGNMLSRRTLEELTEAGSLEGAIALLENTSYAPYVNLEENLELSLKVYLAHVNEDVLKIAPGKAREFLEIMIRGRWDVENIVFILTEKFSGQRIFELPEDLIRLGTLPRDTISSLLEAADVEDVVLKLEKTAYGEFLKNGLREWKATGALSSLIEPLYGYYNSKLLDAASSLRGEDRSITRTILGMRIDSRNIITLLRMKNDGIPPESLEKYLVPGVELYGEVSPAVLEENVQGILHHLAGTSAYPEMFFRAIRSYEKTRNLNDVERILEAEVLRQVEEISSSQVFNIGILLAYLLLKEAEINRVRTALLALKNGMKEDEIKKLVMEAV